MPVDPSLYRSEHHMEYCPEHHELMHPNYSLGGAFPDDYLCPTDGKLWTRVELASQ